MPRADIEAVRKHCADLARTEAGRELRKYLVSVLQDVVPPGQTDGALREENGRRNFARDLILLLEDGSIVDRTESSTERGRGASAGSGGSTGAGIIRPHGAQRRVNPTEPAGSERSADHRAT